MVAINRELLIKGGLEHKFDCILSNNSAMYYGFTKELSEWNYSFDYTQYRVFDFKDFISENEICSAPYLEVGLYETRNKLHPPIHAEAILPIFRK